MKPERRKVWCVDNNVQIGLCRRLMVYWAATWLAIFAVPICSRLMFAELPFFQLASELVSDLWFPMMMSMFVAPIVAWDCIRYSHRLAGPIVRLKKQMSRFADRESVDEMKLRKNDFCHDLASEFNRIVDVYGAPEKEAEVESAESASY